MGGGIYLADNSQSVVIDGTTFMNNVGQWGGALLVGNDNTQVEITDAVFDNNSATSGGGAIHYYYAENTTLTITGSTFSDNSSASSGGGALRLDGNLMTLHVSNSRFEQNTSSNYGGGGISNSANDTTIAISNTDFISNTGYSGGALISSGDFVEMNVQNSQFTGNAANGGSGGGVYFTTGQDSSIDIAGSVFDNNTATFNGGAFINVATAAAISATTFTNNYAVNGGAIAVSGNLDVSNSTFSGNRANESGGGLYANSMMDAITLHNTTVAYNVADDDINGSGNGGGFSLENNAFLSLGNSLIANNIDRSGTAPDCYNPNTQNSGGANLIGDATGCNWSSAADDLIGTAVSPIDPILEPLSGLSPHHPLGIGSPAIDAGSTAPVTSDPNMWPGCRPTDQLGVARPIDGDGNGTAVCDIGAVEAPERFTQTIEPTLATTLTYTDSQNNQTIITIPAGAVTETTTLIFSPETAVTPPANLSFAGHAFTLNAYRSGSLLSGFAFEQPITVTIHYANDEVASMGENSLTLLYWNGSDWSSDGITVVSRDTVNNSLTVTIAHLTKFAMFGGSYQVYLPIVVK